MTPRIEILIYVPVYDGAVHSKSAASEKPTPSCGLSVYARC